MKQKTPTKQMTETEIIAVEGCYDTLIDSALVLEAYGEILNSKLPEDFEYDEGDPLTDGDLLLIAMEELGNHVIPYLKELLKRYDISKTSLIDEGLIDEDE